VEGTRTAGRQTSHQGQYRAGPGRVGGGGRGRGLRKLRPEHKRQLYEACVTPVVDYASTVSHDPLRGKTHLRHLRTVQRTVLIRVLSAFRTVATTTLDVEAQVLLTHLRLRYRAQNTITRIHTLPLTHPIWSALLRAQRRRNNRGFLHDSRHQKP
jgi:hypothetical protein